MAIEQEPFRKYNLDEDNKGQDIVSTRLNPEERKILDSYKQMFDIKSDGKMLKQGALIGFRVLHFLFPPKFMRYLMNKERVKLSDFEDLDKDL